MYILWSAEKFDDKYILFAKNTLDELKQEYLDFCEKNKDDYDFNIELKEKDLDNFSLYSNDSDFYFSNITGVDANETIYIFTFIEDGEGGNRHNVIYFEISNDKEELLTRATEYFLTESRETGVDHINNMIKKLKTDGNYSIPYGETYVCDMEIYQFYPYSEKA